MSTVFAGSSTVCFWPQDEFPDAKFIGVVGSTMHGWGSVGRHFVAGDPIVLYAGDNDLAYGFSPESVADWCKAFLEYVSTRVIVLSIKPSPARWGEYLRQCDANVRMREVCAASPGYWTFLNIVPCLLDGPQPNPALYESGGLHLNAAGYAVVSEVVRAALATIN